jgi:hypothetical protein
MVKICMPGAPGVGSAEKAIRPLAPGKVAQAGDAKSTEAMTTTPVKTARNVNDFMSSPFNEWPGWPSSFACEQ